MNDILTNIAKLGIIPVIAINDETNSIPLAQALQDGGIPCAEITFRTSAAEQAISNITKTFPQMLVGAGTVLTKEQADCAIAAGAKFIVSPGLNPNVIKHCIAKGITVIPGCSTATDIETAISLGIEVVKFFPAEANGGVSMIKALAAPYNKIKFIPTGGINEKNLTEYLHFPKVIACGGSWMVKPEFISSGSFDKITCLTRDAVHNMLGFRLSHIGINSVSTTDANHTAESFEKIFGFTKTYGSKSIFIDSNIEIMKSPYLGKNGHIAIETNSMERAIYYLETHGYEFDKHTISYTETGKLKAIYLKTELSGFALHLIQRENTI